MRIKWGKVYFRAGDGEYYTEENRPGLMIDISDLYVSFGTSEPDWTVKFPYDVIQYVSYEAVSHDAKTTK